MGQQRDRRSGMGQDQALTGGMWGPLLTLCKDHLHKLIMTLTGLCVVFSSKFSHGEEHPAVPDKPPRTQHAGALGEDMYGNVQLCTPALADGHKTQFCGIFLGSEWVTGIRECIP